MTRVRIHVAYRFAAVLAIGLLSSCGPETAEPNVIHVPEGFRVDTLYSPTYAGTGSWISITADDRGRLIASGQQGRLYRITPPPLGAPSDETVVEEIEAEIGQAQGLLWAFNSLYVVVSADSGIAGHGSGLYRLRDLDGDDQLETIDSLIGFSVETPEHGPHGITLGPDGRHLYLVAGNHVDLPQRYTSRISTSWGEDNLFPAIRDPRGHAAHRLAPGGWIARTDSTGSEWEIVAVGLRNAYDLVFNSSGDLFTFDADMEWDIGLPWYRPIRFLFVPSGAEFGWRTGSGKWPEEYLDSVPAVLNIGQGSPTGLVSIQGGAFPAEFQNNLLLFDWSYGTIYRVVLTPDGAGYRASAEPFLSGTPLPLTDGVIAADGALYFVTGGRNLTSYLFRVYHEGGHAPVAPPVRTPEASLRLQIEKNHGRGLNAMGTDSLVALLGYSDRLIRYAARVALERRPVASWRDRVLALTDTRALANGTSGLARTGSPEDLAPALGALRRLRLDPAGETLIDVLRAYSLLFSRQGEPSDSDRQATIDQLSGLFPTGDEVADRELCRLLVYLEDPSIPERALPLLRTAADMGLADSSSVSLEVTNQTEYADQLNEMLRAGGMAQSISYAMSLSHARAGWTDDLRKQYFDWFRQAMSLKGGPSYRGYLDLIRGTALTGVPSDERASLLGEPAESTASLPRPEGPGRSWSINDVIKGWNESLGKPKDFERGRRMFEAALCRSCHAMKGQGGNIGPDLTKVWSRSSIRDLVTAIVTPSAFIPDRFATTVLTLRDGSTITGAIVREDDVSLTVNRNVFDMGDTLNVRKDAIAERELSSVSIMPSGLLNTLNEKEVVDLLDFIRVEGTRNGSTGASK